MTHARLAASIFRLSVQLPWWQAYVYSCPLLVTALLQQDMRSVWSTKRRLLSRVGC